MLDLRQCALGIEFGSTRIKAVLVDGSHAPVAQGDFTWENQLKDGVWTYPLEAVHTGLQHAYAALAADVQAKYGQPLTTVGCIGISAMMHGYLAFDGAGRLLVPFRTWRNTMTGPAAAELTEALGFNIPQRWSIAFLSGASQWGGASGRAGLLYDAGGLCPLAAHRAKGAGRGRCQRHVPHRQRHRRL